MDPKHLYEAIAYTVSATFKDEATRDRYVDWLKAGHVIEVEERAGINNTRLLCIDGELRVEVRYTFPNRAALDRYLHDHAPALRAEGLRLFGPDSGAVFARSTAVIVYIPGQIPC
ncbi:MAG: DUF4286 family protein [Phycisphaerales bacterium]